MKNLVTSSPTTTKEPVLHVDVDSKSNKVKRTKRSSKASIFKPIDNPLKNAICLDRPVIKPIITLDMCNLTLPIPDSELKAINSKLDKLKEKLLNSGRMAENKQYKSNCFREHGQYKDYVVIRIKTTKMDALVYIGYRPIGKQNPLWIRFNPAYFTQLGYRQLKRKLAKILGMELLLSSFANAIPTRLDIAVDIPGITPNYLLVDMRDARNSAIHLKSGQVESIRMGTNRSTTAVLVYLKGLGTRVEIRLSRMNTANKPVTLSTLAASLPANPFKRLDIYKVDEADTFSAPIRLVVAASRAFGLKAALQTLDQSDRRLVRKQLAQSKVEHFDADHVWTEVVKLLKPLRILYTANTVMKVTAKK